MATGANVSHLHHKWVSHAESSWAARLYRVFYAHFQAASLHMQRREAKDKLYERLVKLDAMLQDLNDNTPYITPRDFPKPFFKVSREAWIRATSEATDT